MADAGRLGPGAVVRIETREPFDQKSTDLHLKGCTWLIQRDVPVPPVLLPSSYWASFVKETHLYMPEDLPGPKRRRSQDWRWVSCDVDAPPLETSTGVSAMLLLEIPELHFQHTVHNKQNVRVMAICQLECRKMTRPALRPWHRLMSFRTQSCSADKTWSFPVECRQLRCDPYLNCKYLRKK